METSDTSAGTKKIKVFLLDDHEVVRRGLRDLLESERRHRGGGRVGLGPGGDPAASPRCARTSRSSTAGCRTAPASTSAGRSARGTRSIAALDPHVVRRRRGAVLRDHGRGGRLRPQADPRPATSSTPYAGSRPASRCSTPRSPQQVLDRLRDGPKQDTALAGLTEQERKVLELIGEGLTNRADRRADVPRREDRQELRVEPARQARARTPHPGRGVRQQAPAGTEA